MSANKSINYSSVNVSSWYLFWKWDLFFSNSISNLEKLSASIYAASFSASRNFSWSRTDIGLSFLLSAIIFLYSSVIYYILACSITFYFLYSLRFSFYFFILIILFLKAYSSSIWWPKNFSLYFSGSKSIQSGSVSSSSSSIPPICLAPFTHSFFSTVGGNCLFPGYLFLAAEGAPPGLSWNFFTSTFFVRVTSKPKGS